jgi:hypothetical protein
MRFFDEDNRQFEWTLSIAAFILVLYVGSFVVIRQKNTLPCEVDGCNWNSVSFPQGLVTNVYFPLIGWDCRLNSVKYPGDH